MSLPTTSREISRRMAFNVGRTEISEIAKIISDENTRLKVSFSLSDGTRVSSDDISDLLNFANSNIRSITNIRLRANSVIFSQTANEGSFEAGADGRIRYDLSGNDEWVMLNSRNLEELLENSRLAWSVTYTETVKITKFLILFFGLWVSSALTFVKADVPQGWSYGQFVLDGRGGFHNGVPGIFLLVILLHIFVPIRAVRRLFPVGSFCIGGGIQRFENSKYWRRAVLGLVILSIPGTIAARIFFSR